ncbi:hypothetical protein ACQZV8_04345 [Magnetococcales bacterium HHB-1]
MERRILIFLMLLLGWSGSAFAIDIKIELQNGKSVSGSLQAVKLDPGFEILASKIKALHVNQDGGSSNDSTVPVNTVLSVDGIFAAKGNEADKDGFVPVSSYGGYIPNDLLNSSLPVKGMSSVEIVFWGGHYADDYGTGFARFVFLSGERIVKEARFDIANIVEDKEGKMANWQIYRLQSSLKKYHKIIRFREMQDISDVKIFVHPGNWAVVIRDLKINVRR